MPRPDSHPSGLREAVGDYLRRATAGTPEPLDQFLSTTGFAREAVSRMFREIDGSDAALGHGDAANGTLIANRYRIVSLLGCGGMGTVHLAIDTTLGREVALKRIRRELLLSAEARHSFDNEVRVVAQLDHASICKVFDAGAGVANYALVIPNRTAFLGVTLGFQGAALDPPATSLGLTTSNGVALVVGT
ncbi:MAG: hypothetical protein IPK26_20030 [Planctomycetes bacterium]|nr:hypothetical protein [Planctomycetota bacterium]